MKKRYAFLIILPVLMIMGVQTVTAQVGVKGGVNLSKFVGSDSGPAEDKLGLNVGATFRLFGIGPVSINPEIYYSEKGTRFSDQVGMFMGGDPEQFDFNGNPDDFDLEFNLAYIEVPIMLKISLPFLGGDVVQPFITGGPVFAWRVDCSFSLETAEDISVQQCANQNFPDLETTFKNADQGYALGSGLDFKIPVLGTLILEGRYVRGLSRLREDGENNDIQNQSFSLMAGFTLGF